MKQRLTVLGLISLLWGSEWLLNGAVSSIPRFRLLALRFAIAGLAMVPVVLHNKPARLRVPIFGSVLLGIVVIALPILFLAKRTDISPGIVVVCFALLPLIVSILESPGGLRNAAALLGGLAGTAFLVRGGLSFSLSQTTTVSILLLLMVLASILFVRVKRWLSVAGIPASVMVQMFTAAAVFGGYSLLSERDQVFAWKASALAATGVLGVLGGAMAFAAFYWLLLNATASQTLTVQWLVPVVGVIETAILLRHLPAWDSVLGGIVSIVSVIAMLRAPAQGDAPLTLQITDSPQHQNASLHSGGA